ncbi:hypothetical protein PILCRDRAFT_84587 [Piloderma croceum F 1598]|uniref:Uncharacterized protein n=1 Tax=Piloderma croceum (strain F 1598) TaxID=765440 RepID=A0A0C3GD51_PILCF|nr:hypothetical protein PILCRDRAFT_84587 [Piloderma croceum F 1598]
MNLDVDKNVLRALVNKLQQEKMSLTQELQMVLAGMPSTDDIAETVQMALTQKYQENIANLVADAQRQKSLRLEAEHKLAELEQQLQLPSTPTGSPMSLQDHYPTPISPSVPYPQFVNTSQTANTAGYPASSLSLVEFEHNNVQPLAPSPHNQPDESSKRAKPTVTLPPSLLPISKSKGRAMSADENPRWETGGEPKRRQINKTAQMEAIAGPSMNASQLKDRPSVVDIACDDLPAWRVKVEPPVEDENNKLMEEGDDTDQLCDEYISRVSTGTHDDGRPSLSHVSPILGSRLTSAHSTS